MSPASPPPTKFKTLFFSALKGGDHNYTEIHIKDAIILLAIPMMLEMCLESVFAVVDIYFVNGLGPDAVTVVGLTEACMTLIYSVAIGLSAATTAIVSRRVGEKNHQGASNAAVHSLLLALALSIGISLIGIFFSNYLLQVMGASADAIKEGASYTQIMICANAVVMFLFLINGIFRGDGNAVIAMRSLWLANAINIVLCPLLIYGIGPFPEMGIAGAATATVIGRGTGVLYQLYHLFISAHSFWKKHQSQFKFEFTLIKSISNIASPATLQFLVQSASWIVLAAIVARSGSAASAGYQTAIRLFLFFILPAWGISNAAATLVGQNLGAQKTDRAIQSVNKIVKYNAWFMGLVTLMLFTLGIPVLHFFIPKHEVLEYQYALQALFIISSAYVIYGVSMVYMQAINGAGDTKAATKISFIGFWLFQIPLAFVLSMSLNLGPLGVFLAIPISECFIAYLYWRYFKLGTWSTISV